MAVTQEFQNNSKKPVEEPVQHCDGEGTDSGPRGCIQHRKSDGPSTSSKGIMKNDIGVVKRHKLGGNRNKDHSDQLSDIDDAEVVGYLLTKKEMHLKRVIWEAMNERYIKAKKQKQAAEKKKGVSDKKASKTTGKVEPEKICESALTTGPDSHAHGSQSSPHGMHGSNESWCEEDEHDKETFGNDENCQYNNDNDEDYYYDDFDS